MIPLRAAYVLGFMMLAWFHSTSAGGLPQYHRISVTGPDDIDRLYPIIAAYAQDPELAETVREITIDGVRWRRGCLFRCDPNKPTTQTEPNSPIRDAAHIALEEHVRSLKLGQSATTAMIRSLEWKKRYILGAWDGPQNEIMARNEEFGSAAAAILLSLCINLETFYLVTLPHIPPLKDYILKSNYNKTPVPGLQKLTRVEALPMDALGDPRYYSNFEFMEVFQLFHHLPSIQSILVEGAQEYQQVRNLAVPQTGSMRKIHIEHADLPSSTLAKIISIPMALDELSVSLGGLWNTDGGFPKVEASELIPALRQHQETLTLLDLDLDFPLSSHEWPAGSRMQNEELEERERLRYGYEYLEIDRAIQAASISYKEEAEGHGNDRTIGSLTGFRSMKKLSISIKALMGFDIKKTHGRLIDRLPVNLESLRLYGYQSGSDAILDEQIDELLALKAERLPKLIVVEGVDVMVPSLRNLYPYKTKIKEDKLWKRPQREIGWKEVELPRVEVPKIEVVQGKDEL